MPSELIQFVLRLPCMWSTCFLTRSSCYLSQIADKLLINALSISLWVNGTIPSALVGLWLFRDVTLMVATYRYVAQNTAPGMSVWDPVTVSIQVTPTTISKLNTGLQFVTLAAGIVAVVPPSAIVAVSDLPMTTDIWVDVSTFRIYVTHAILPALCWTTGATTILSSFSYWGHSAFVAATARTTTSTRPMK
jgi:phosphatidylglycerophosphate synthase